MTLVLALDTATERIAVGVGRVGNGGEVEVLASVDEDAPRAALSRLLPAVGAALDAAGVAIGECEVIAAGRGPGSFTGVRIGVATAKGLARGLDSPLAGIGTLDAVAWRLCGHTGLVGVVGDAMRGEVYPALFRCGQRAERLSDDRVARPEDVAREWGALGEPVLLTGNGLAKYADVFAALAGDAAAVADAELWPPTGASLLAALAASPPADRKAPGELLPVYTRLSDAEEKERTAGAAGAAPPPVSGVAGSEASP